MANPEVIVACYPGAEDAQLAARREREAWASLGTVSAVRNGHIHVIPSDWLTVPGPRMGQTARLLADLFSAAAANIPAKE